eukprot:58503-Chlamydomonas_euryale.AAC.5
MHTGNANSRTKGQTRLATVDARCPMRFVWVLSCIELGRCTRFSASVPHGQCVHIKGDAYNGRDRRRDRQRQRMGSAGGAGNERNGGERIEHVERRTLGAGKHPRRREVRAAWRSMQHAAE